jgi:dihydroxyacid dehydratase/phosphogluconate dehydratase
LGKLVDGDLIEIVIDRSTLEGRVNFVGSNDQRLSAEEGARVLAARAPRKDLAPDPLLPDDTRLWAALQEVSGGTWGGSIYDIEAILAVIDAGRRAIAKTDTVSGTGGSK